MKIFVDVDGVVIDTTGALADYYNEHYHSEEDFTEADGDKIEVWDAHDQLPLMNGEIEHIFESDYFWDNVRIKPNAQLVLEYLSTKHDVYFVSIGSSINIGKKTKFLRKHFPFVHNHIMLAMNGDMSMDKSVVNMEGGMIIDDHMSNLNSSNARFKVLFKDLGEKEWNKYDVSTTPDIITKGWFELVKHGIFGG